MRSIAQFTALAAVIVSPVIATSIAPAGDACSGCSLLGSLSVSLSSIEPSEPEVGDVVTFRFRVDYALPGGFDCDFNGSCAFSGGEPILTGSERATYAGNEVVVRRTAVEAGEATVQLNLRGHTEEACQTQTEFGCQTIFQQAFIDASTGPLDVEILAAETPTATPTSTPTFTPTHRTVGDDDGCAITNRPAAGGFGVLAMLVLPAILRLARRRTGPAADPRCSGSLARPSRNWIPARAPSGTRLG